MHVRAQDAPALVQAVGVNMTLQAGIKRFFGRKDPFTPPEPGVYHYRHQNDDGESRIHLRINDDGGGFLLVNASRIYYFNPTAIYMAYMTLEKVNPSSIVDGITRQYRISRKQALCDYEDLAAQIGLITSPNFEELAARLNQVENCESCSNESPGDLKQSKTRNIPQSNLETEIRMPFTAKLSAPYRMDLAITYRCNNDCSHCYNARPRQFTELPTQEWEKITDRAWELGIPHIIFTGGEPTLRPDLPELIAHAEKIGQITGLNTNGRKLKDPIFVQQLVDSGLDHVQITLESHDPNIHDAMVAMPGAWKDTVAGLKNALSTRLYVMTNTTILQNNKDTLLDTLSFLAEVGVKRVGLNALIYSGHGLEVGTGLPESALPGLLKVAKEFTQNHGQKLIWYTPTQYCHFDPVYFDPGLNTGLDVKGCTAALYNMCIEPDGSVIPCQSYYESLGYFLEDTWDHIWNHPLAISLRERKEVPFPCESCDLLHVCGGGCPLAVRKGNLAAPKPVHPFEV